MAAAAPSLAVMMAGSAPPPPRRGAPVFRRGINIHNMMNWPRVKPWPDQTFEWPPFKGDIYEVGDGEIAALRGMGFDFVRLTVQPAIFIQATGAQRAELHALLLANVRRFLASGLGVIVDPHPVTQHEDYQPRDFLGASDNPLLDAYASVLGEIAKTLAPLSSQRVALELMNEPELGEALERLRWPAIARRLFEAVRTVAPDLLVVVTGAAWGTWVGLVELDPKPFAGPRTIFTFHFYEPREFTHQSALNAADMRFLSGVPWPATATGMEAARAKARALVASTDLDRVAKRKAATQADRALAAYEKRGADATAITDVFRRIAAWADLHGIFRAQILLGEFGAVRRDLNSAAADDADRQAWLRTVRSAAESSGFGWAYWAYRGPGGMGLVAEDRTQLDLGGLAALGLQAPA